MDRTEGSSFDPRKLWLEVDRSVGPYPPGVEPVPEAIPGTAFFPGGYGIWRPELAEPIGELPRGGVLVIGQDFHSVSEYRKSLARGEEGPKVPTWRELDKVLRGGGLQLEQCFFTNAYMGLRSVEKATGPFPGRRDPAFVARCDVFLYRQMTTALPRLIVTLGIPALQAVGRVLRIPGWAEAGGFREVDDHPQGPFVEACPPDFGPTVAVVALLHPSLRAANLRHRRYKGQVGPEAERRMLTDAVKWSSMGCCPE